MQILIAAQRDERRLAMSALHAALAGQHAAQAAAVVSRFADRRTAAANLTDPAERQAQLGRIAYEESSELLRLVLEHAAEKRCLERELSSSLAGRHRVDRRELGIRHRRQRLGFALTLRHRQPNPSRSQRRPSVRAILAARRDPDGKH